MLQARSAKLLSKTYADLAEQHAPGKKQAGCGPLAEPLGEEVKEEEDRAPPCKRLRQAKAAAAGTSR